MRDAGMIRWGRRALMAASKPRMVSSGRSSRGRVGFDRSGSPYSVRQHGSGTSWREAHTYHLALSVEVLNTAERHGRGCRRLGVIPLFQRPLRGRTELVGLSGNRVRGSLRVVALAGPRRR